MTSDVAQPPRVLGPLGSAECTPIECRAGATIALISASVRAHHSTLIDRLLDRASQLQTVVGVPSLPRMSWLLDAAKRLRSSDAATIVAIGGGSVLDTAKVLTVLPSETSESSTSFDSLLRNDLRRRPALIVVPTTAGTGAEVTPFASIWDATTGRKESVEHDCLIPDLVVLVPELLRTCPPALARSCALDALGHCVESLWGRRRTDESAEFAWQGLDLLLAAIPRIASGFDPGVAADLHRASVMGGRAIRITRTAISHAISYPLTGLHGIPHGVAVAMSIPLVLRYLRDHDHPVGADRRIGHAAELVAGMGLGREFAGALRDCLPDMIAVEARRSSRLANFVLGVPEPDLGALVRDTIEYDSN